MRKRVSAATSPPKQNNDRPRSVFASFRRSSLTFVFHYTMPNFFLFYALIGSLKIIGWTIKSNTSTYLAKG